MRIVTNLLFVILLLFAPIGSKAGIFRFTDSTTTHLIGKYSETFEDTSGRMTIEQVRAATGFVQSKDDVPHFGITKSICWLRFDIENETHDPRVNLTLQYSALDGVELYTLNADGSYTKEITGEYHPITLRKYPNQNFIFDLVIPHGEKRTYYIKIKSSEQILVPLTVGTYKETVEYLNVQDILTSIFFGIILVMIFYNLFVYFTVRDGSYLWYVFYILFVGLTQIGFQGFSYKYFWPGMPRLANQSIIFFPAITGILAIEFFKNFLQVKNYSKRIGWVLNALNIFYVVNCILSVTGNHQLAQQLLQPNAMLASLVIMGFSTYAIRKGNRSAGFFLVAWITFLVGIVVFIMKDVGVVPYNTFTNYILQIGAAVQVVVLSFALADKINIFRKEKEASQAEALEALQENERIIREQNVILEGKVNERTYELKLSNDELNKAMRELKEAESQLVESEKMASLGQLTAGIAHEINNPINFVTSNVKPLNRDVLMLIEAVNEMEAIVAEEGTREQKLKKIADYKNDIDFDYLKEEIDQLLSGIGEGASRTAEIVKGLRIFSRLDEDDLKKADINEGLESTLVITNNLLNNSIKVEKHYGNLPLIECYPGKLNQVFLNMISNAIYALKKKFNGADGGVLSITTYSDDQYLYVKIGDNGIGMDENTKKRLFEPFFTTKDVGEGTGLGLSISYNTINKHNGRIEVNSELGKGTDFILILPLIQK